jgi:nucleoside-diphosphate-sugar epimerase
LIGSEYVSHGRSPGYAEEKIMAGTITVFGGTGFIGRHLVPPLVRSGATVRLAVRHPGRAQRTTVSGQPPELIQADVLDDVLSPLQSRGRMPS